MSKGKGESGTNKLLEQQLLVWHSGDEVQIQASAK